jgi:hypothetical protein
METKTKGSEKKGRERAGAVWRCNAALEWGRVKKERLQSARRRAEEGAVVAAVAAVAAAAAATAA